MKLTERFEPAFELERRFLVADRSVARGAPSQEISQAYVFATDGYAIRVRSAVDRGLEERGQVGRRAWITGKGPRVDAQREVYEFEVPSRTRGFGSPNSRVVLTCNHLDPPSGSPWKSPMTPGTTMMSWLNIRFRCGARVQGSSQRMIHPRSDGCRLPAPTNHDNSPQAEHCRVIAMASVAGSTIPAIPS